MQTLYDRYIVSLTTYLGTKKLLIWEQLVGLSKRYVDEEMQRRGSNSISRVHGEPRWFWRWWRIFGND